MPTSRKVGDPFATVIARDDEILAESPNRVSQTIDPTAHAEILAIREACTRLGTEHLTGCTIYVLAHPCPMCLGSLARMAHPASRKIPWRLWRRGPLPARGAARNAVLVR